MPAVHLVRHGQASFGAGDYDRLSALGHEQARAVGAALRRRGVVPSVVVHGGLRRQRETAEAIAAAWSADAAAVDDAAGADVAAGADDAAGADAAGDAAAGPPPLREDARWDEYDHRELLTAFRPRYRSGAVLAADMARTLQPAKAFQAALEDALARWTGGAHDGDYRESYAAFGARIGAALDAVVADGDAGQRPGSTVVVSSAGAIGAVVAGILRLDAPAWAALNRVAVNTGVSTVVAGARGRSVVSFNDHGHLDGPGRPARTTR